MSFREGREQPQMDRLRIEVASQEAAIQLVKDFWDAIPHGGNFTKPENDEDWMGELTMGDKTKVVRGFLPNEKGKWFVQVMGNNQPLSNDALNWLRARGHI